MNRTALGRHGRIADESGDPLDGLVNLFDLGLVLAVAFLVAGLASRSARPPPRSSRAPHLRPQQRQQAFPNNSPAPRPPAAATPSAPSTASPTAASSWSSRAASQTRHTLSAGLTA